MTSKTSEGQLNRYDLVGKCGLSVSHIRFSSGSPSGPYHNNCDGEI